MLAKACPLLRGRCMNAHQQGSLFYLPTSNVGAMLSKRTTIPMSYSNQTDGTKTMITAPGGGDMERSESQEVRLWRSCGRDVPMKSFWTKGRNTGRSYMYQSPRFLHRTGAGNGASAGDSEKLVAIASKLISEGPPYKKTKTKNTSPNLRTSGWIKRRKASGVDQVDGEVQVIQEAMKLCRQANVQFEQEVYRVLLKAFCARALFPYALEVLRIMHKAGLAGHADYLHVVNSAACFGDLTVALDASELAYDRNLAIDLLSLRCIVHGLCERSLAAHDLRCVFRKNRDLSLKAVEMSNHDLKRGVRLLLRANENNQVELDEKMFMPLMFALVLQRQFNSASQLLTFMMRRTGELVDDSNEVSDTFFDQVLDEGLYLDLRKNSCGIEISESFFRQLGTALALSRVTSPSKNSVMYCYGKIDGEHVWLYTSNPGPWRAPQGGEFCRDEEDKVKLDQRKQDWRADKWYGWGPYFVMRELHLLNRKSKVDNKKLASSNQPFHRPGPLLVAAPCSAPTDTWRAIEQYYDNQGTIKACELYDSLLRSANEDYESQKQLPALMSLDDDDDDDDENDDNGDAQQLYELQGFLTALEESDGDLYYHRDEPFELSEHIDMWSEDGFTLEYRYVFHGSRLLPNKRERLFYITPDQDASNRNRGDNYIMVTVSDRWKGAKEVLMRKVNGLLSFPPFQKLPKHTRVAFSMLDDLVSQHGT